ncbi:MAG: type 4a pilus biogenesis protein PilO [Desulfobacterales bacterium]
MKKSSLSSSIEPYIQKIGQLPRMQRILIAAGTGVLIIGVFIYFFCMPKYKEIDRLKDEIAKTEKKLEETKEKAAALDEYKEKIEAARAKFTIVSRALPLKDEVPSLLTSVSQAGKDSGLAFLLFEPKEEKKQDFYAEIPINMQLSGSYHDLGEFFDKLAGMSRIVNVKNFEMTSKDVMSTELGINCTAETYKFIESSGEDNKK